jgi:CBS domain-containing protein
MVTEMSGRDEVEVLEGDEGEPEVGRGSDVGRQILLTRLSDVIHKGPPVTLPADATVAKAVDVMKRKRVSAVMVVDTKKPKRLLGIFTERDVVKKALEVKGFAKLTLRKVMTKEPESLSAKDSVAYALNKMSVGGYRHVPVVDDKGIPTGMVSTRDLIDFIVELCPEEILNLPPAPKYAIPKDQEGP